MTYEDAMGWLCMEEAAQRATWRDHQFIYLEPADGPGAMRQTEWDEASGTNSTPTPYTPTDEDRAATDWIAYAG